MVASQTVVVEVGLRRYANAANGRTGFAPSHATGTKWTMWPDIPTGTKFHYAIFVPRTARNPQATLTIEGKTSPFEPFNAETGKCKCSSTPARC